MKVRRLRFILGFTFLLLSFQNCNSPNSTSNQTPATSKDSKSTGSSSMGSSSGGSTGLNSGSARGITGGSSGSKSGSGFGGISGGAAGSISSGGSSSSGGTGGTCLGCGSGGSSSGGGSGGMFGGSGNDPTFRITTQPVSKTIAEGSEFFVGVSIAGGKGPYTFKWYLNNVEIAPLYGAVHYESYSNLLDRIHKEGDYHVVITDAAGAKLTSNKARVLMTAKPCPAANYYIDLNVRTNPNDGYFYFNDLFRHNGKKYFLSPSNPTVSMMQLHNAHQVLGTLGFGYFTLGGATSHNQSFSIACSTDVPTIHTSECATNNLGKCYYYDDDYQHSNKTYEGEINFVCRSGYVEFISNTCNLVTPPPSQDNGS